MTVHDLLHILIDADPNAKVVVSYHVDACTEGAFYDDDVATFAEYSGDSNNDGHPMFFLLTRGFIETVGALS